MSASWVTQNEAMPKMLLTFLRPKQEKKKIKAVGILKKEREPLEVI